MRHQKFINKETGLQVVVYIYLIQSPDLGPSLHFSYPQRGGNKSLGERRKGKSYRLLGLSLPNSLLLAFHCVRKTSGSFWRILWICQGEWARPNRNTYVYAMSSSFDSGLSICINIENSLNTKIIKWKSK